MKKYILILTILLIILAGIGYWFYSPISNAEEFYGKSHDKGFVVESNNEEFKTVGEKGILEVNKEYYKNNKYFITSFNPTYLLLTRVSERGDKDNLIYQYYLKRNFSGFEFLKYGKYLTTNKTFPEAIAIAQKYDLSKENPDPENIRVQTPPSKAEVEDSKKRAEERKREGEISDEKDYWNTYIKPSNSENKTEKKEFIEKYLKTLIEFKARREQDPAGEIEFYKIKCTPERAKTTDFKMCDFDDGIKLANQYLKELEEKK